MSDESQTADPNAAIEAALGPPCAEAEVRVVELTDALAAQEERLAGLVRVAANLGNTRDPKKAMRGMVSEISRLLDADRSTIYALSEDDQMLHGLAVQGETSVEVGVEIGRGIAGLVAQRGRAINLKDAYRHPAFDQHFDRLTGYRTQSMLVVPMRNPKREVIGVLQALNKRTGYFTVEDENLMNALAQQAAITLEALHLQLRLNLSNAELRDLSEQLQDRVQELELLYDNEQSISGADTPEELIAAVLPQIAQVARCEAVAVFMPDPETGLGPAWVTGMDDDDVQSVKLEVGEGLLGKAASRGETIRLARPEDFESLGLPRALGRALAPPVVDAVLTPLRDGDLSSGVLALVNLTDDLRDGDGDDGLRLAVLLAGQLARALNQMALRKSAQQRDRLITIGQMLSGVMHDLRGPMAIISGYSQLMAEEDAPAAREKMSETIRRQVLLFNDMTKEVMSFATGERSILVRKVFLDRFIAAVAESLKPEFAERHVGFEVQNNAGGIAWFDEAKMLRVVTNIARNARQALGNRGTFTWTLERTETEGIRMRLADDGPGIPEKIRGAVFEAFTTAGKAEGTGLGLAIVRRIVEDHGGTIAVNTETDVGTEFVVELPPHERSA